MTEPDEGKTETKPKGSRHRSPAYPSLNLREAVQKADTLYRDRHLQPVPVEAVAKICGFDGLSGVGARAISALKQFGLLEEVEDNGSRRLRLSDLGRKIVQLPHDDTRRKAAISEAARKPAIHSDLLDLYPAGLPEDDTALKSYLEYERRFNRNAIEPLIKEIRDTWSFAEIEECGTMSLMGEDLPPHERHSMMTTATAKPGGNPPPPQLRDSGVEFLELPIPEVRGYTAILRTPMPETEEECEHIQDVVNANVEAWKRAIVRRRARQRERDKDS